MTAVRKRRIGRPYKGGTVPRYSRDRAYSKTADGPEHDLMDALNMLYATYKMALEHYPAENIAFLGGSSGAAMVLWLMSFINQQGEGTPMPGKIALSSPGSALTAEERKHAEAPEQYKKLLDYIKKHQMQIVGFSREIKLIDYISSILFQRILPLAFRYSSST